MFYKIVSSIFVFCLLVSCAGKGTVVTAPAPTPAPPAVEEPTIDWTDARGLRVEGQGWTDTVHPWDRLPARAEGAVTPAVWNLGRHTAGICVRFVSDSPEIHAAWSGGEAMYHMPRSGVSGLDLYYRTKSGDWQWRGIGRPKEERTEDRLATAPYGGMVEYLVFLPLYQKVDELMVGVKPGSQLLPAPERPGGKAARILFYGTSITQGGCASRTGMSHAAILSRWLDREVINLGFSGAGKMEPVMADLVREQEAGLYVFECLPNMTVEMVKERVEPFVLRVREVRRETPILLVENCLLNPESGHNVALRAVYDRLVANGVKNLHYLPNNGMLAAREESTVDGVHPTDLGFLVMAEYYEPVLREILEKK